MNRNVLVPGVSDLTAHMGYLLRMTSNAASQEFARKVASEGVTVAEWVMLRSLYGSETIALNDNWDGDPEISATGKRIGAGDLISETSKDAAILITLDPGIYTVHVSGADGGTGVGLVEIYEVPEE